MALKNWEFNERDRLLQARMKAGDSGALTEVRMRYSTMLAYTAYGITRDDEESKDIIADGLATLWRKCRESDEPIDIGAYLYKVVLNRSLQYLNRTKKRQISEKVFLSIQSRSLYGDPLRYITYKELKRAFMETIYALPPQQQKVAVFKYILEKSHKEIGTLLGISEQTSREYLALVKKRMIIKLTPLM